MAIKRKYNGTRQQAGPDAESPYLTLPWGKEQDELFDAWLTEHTEETLTSVTTALLAAGLTVKLGVYNESFCCTLDSKEAREAGGKHLLSGWSDTVEDCVFLAYWKFAEQIGGDFTHPSVATVKSRRR